MFEPMTGTRPSPERLAELDRQFAALCPEDTAETREVIERVVIASRAESRAAGQRLVAIGELFALRLREFGQTEDWAVDTHDEVTAEIAAALRVSPGLAGSQLRYARALRERLPKVGAALVAGDIDYRLFQTMVFRTDLITDEDLLAAVDDQLAVAAPRWPTLTRGRLAGKIDAIVARADRDAVRQRRTDMRDRQVCIDDREGGTAEIHGSLFSTDAHALDRRLDALAATVCAADPRTREQRRADALGALAAGADRLGCRCATTGCPAASSPPAGPVIIHVLAEAATVEGRSDMPGAQLAADQLIPAELITDLATSARLRPLIHPADAEPEPGRTPSPGLADFVRCRDLTCRFPGCDRPAVGCDLDHTIPHGDGGATHASNLKCLCRLHHLLKTFWGWRDKQLRDGTIIWTSPAGDTYVTTPGSALLFPSLCTPTGALPSPATPAPQRTDRTLKMPKRTRTRTQNRAHTIASERRRTPNPRRDRYRPTTTQGRQ
jgi:Domain of unknown function (DUF222)